MQEYQAVRNNATHGAAHGAAPEGCRGSTSRETAVSQGLGVVEAVRGGGLWFIETIYWCVFPFVELNGGCRIQHDNQQTAIPEALIVRSRTSEHCRFADSVRHVAPLWYEFNLRESRPGPELLFQTAQLTEVSVQRSLKPQQSKMFFYSVPQTGSQGV